MDIFGRIRSENQQIYLNTGKVVGIQTLEVNPAFGNTPLNYLGIGRSPVYQILDSEQSATVTVNSILVDQDYFINYTGLDCFNMFILPSQNDINNNYALISGYLTNYTIKFSIGGPVQTVASIKFLNNAGKIGVDFVNSGAINQLSQIPNIQYYNDLEERNLPYFGLINLTLDEYSTNRVTECQVTFQINRTPIYNIGNRTPKKIQINYPIIVNCDFTLEINDSYENMALSKFPTGLTTQNISIDIPKSLVDTTSMLSLDLKNMTPITEQKNLSTDNSTIIQKRYVGFIFP